MTTPTSERPVTSLHCAKLNCVKPDLYRRGCETLLASWEEYARGATGAAVQSLPGVAAAVFPNEPERAVYIDDVEANVAAARPFGIHAIHFTTPARLREELVALGLLPSRTA